MQDRLQSFAIPSHWFTDSFVTAQSPEVVRFYAEAFADFKRRTPAHFAGIDTLKTRVHVDAASPVDIRTRRWTPAESRPRVAHPRLTRSRAHDGEIRNRLRSRGSGQGARLTSWIESFVYLDGAFRSFGQGSKPFWTPVAPPKPSNP